MRITTSLLRALGREIAGLFHRLSATGIRRNAGTSYVVASVFAFTVHESRLLDHGDSAVDFDLSKALLVIETGTIGAGVIHSTVD